MRARVQLVATQQVLTLCHHIMNASVSTHHDVTHISRRSPEFTFGTPGHGICVKFELGMRKKYGATDQRQSKNKHGATRRPESGMTNRRVTSRDVMWRTRARDSGRDVWTSACADTDRDEIARSRSKISDMIIWYELADIAQRLTVFYSIFSVLYSLLAWTTRFIRTNTRVRTSLETTQ